MSSHNNSLIMVAFACNLMTSRLIKIMDNSSKTLDSIYNNSLG